MKVTGTLKIFNKCQLLFLLFFIFKTSHISHLLILIASTLVKEVLLNFFLCTPSTIILF